MGERGAGRTAREKLEGLESMSNYDTDIRLLVEPEVYSAQLMDATGSADSALVAFAGMVRDGSKGCGRLPPGYIAEVFKRLSLESATPRAAR